MQTVSAAWERRGKRDHLYVVAAGLVIRRLARPGGAAAAGLPPAGAPTRRHAARHRAVEFTRAVAEEAAVPRARVAAVPEAARRARPLVLRRS